MRSNDVRGLNPDTRSCWRTATIIPEHIEHQQGESRRGYSPIIPRTNFEQ